MTVKLIIYTVHENLSLFPILISLFLIVVLCDSCSKKNSGSELIPASYLKASVTTGGKTISFIADSIHGATYNINTVPGMSVIGTQANQEIDLSINPYQISQTGSYNLKNATSLATWGKKGFYINTPLAVSGNITVLTATSTYITGSFNYICSDSSKVIGTFGSSFSTTGY